MTLFKQRSYNCANEKKNNEYHSICLNWHLRGTCSNCLLHDVSMQLTRLLQVVQHYLYRNCTLWYLSEDSVAISLCSFDLVGDFFLKLGERYWFSHKGYRCNLNKSHIFRWGLATYCSCLKDFLKIHFLTSMFLFQHQVTQLVVMIFFDATMENVLLTDGSVMVPTIVKITLMKMWTCAVCILIFHIRVIILIFIPFPSFKFL